VATQDLRENAEALITAEGQLFKAESELADPSTGKSATDAKLQQLATALKHPLLAEYPRWQAERRYITAVTSAVKTVANQLADAVDGIDTADLFPSALDPASPNADLLQPLASVKKGVDQVLATLKTESQSRLDGLTQPLTQKVADWQARFRTKTAEYAQFIKGLPSGDVKQAEASRATLAKRLEHLSGLERQAAKLGARITELKDARTRLLAQLRGARTDRFRKRAARAAQWEAALAGGIGIKILQGAERTDYRAYIHQLAEGSYIRQQDLQTIAQSVDPITLADRLLGHQVSQLARETGLKDDIISRFVAQVHIPAESVHRFRLKARSDSGAIRAKLTSPIGVE
jgi:hypothetical protein